MTFWLPVVHGSRFVVLRFVDEGFISEHVRLEIGCHDEEQREVVVHSKRVYLVFGLSDEKLNGNCTPMKLDCINSARNEEEGLLAVEWGAVFVGQV